MEVLPRISGNCMEEISEERHLLPSLRTPSAMSSRLRHRPTQCNDIAQPWWNITEKWHMRILSNSGVYATAGPAFGDSQHRGR
jgi:hypothetical protein